MGPILTLAVVSCAGCVIVKFVISLRVKVVEKELKECRRASRSARKKRNAAIEAVSVLKRDLGKLEAKQAKLEKGIYQLTMTLRELERAEEKLELAEAS